MISNNNYYNIRNNEYDVNNNIIIYNTDYKLNNKINNIKIKDYSSYWRNDNNSHNDYQNLDKKDNLNIDIKKALDFNNNDSIINNKIETDYNINNNSYNIINEKNNNEYKINNDSISKEENTNQKKDIIDFTQEINPESNFALSELVKISQIGKGTEGTIYSVKWKKNNKKYALKKSKLKLYETVEKRKEEIMMLKNFRKNTGSDGIIITYGELYVTNKHGFYDFYEIMELADMDWEHEIYNRAQIHLYYEENELMEIMHQIVTTFCLLQKNHITHRDIKPQNIMLVNGKFKICDFGNARILKREGMVVQRIRGSEMYMSPLMFKGFHAKLPQIKHHTFKSDVFSLGMCFLLAAALSYNPLNNIREKYDMNIIKKIITQYLQSRYSQKVLNILFSMLQVEENLRPDFIQLETFFSNTHNYF